MGAATCWAGLGLVLPPGGEGISLRIDRLIFTPLRLLGCHFLFGSMVRQF